MKRKLIIFMLVVPGSATIALMLLLLGINEFYANRSAVDATEAANSNSETKRAEIADEFARLMDVLPDGLDDKAAAAELSPEDLDAYHDVVSDPAILQGIDYIALAGNSPASSFPKDNFKEADGYDAARYEWWKSDGAFDRDAALGNFLADHQAAQEIKEVEWIDRNNWLVTVGVIGVFSFALLALATLMLWFREDTLPLTWAEAIVYATVAFLFLIAVHGFIPHYILKVWDSVIAEGKWGWFDNVKEAGGNSGTFQVFLTEEIADNVLDPLIFWKEDVDRQGWAWAWFVVRDLILTAWYGIGVVGMLAGGYWSQKLMARERAGEKKQPKVPSVSKYGRPLTAGGPKW